jgi:hypothetical protein
MHELPLGRAEIHALYPDSLLDVHEALKLAAGEGFAEKAADAAVCAGVLQAARGKVRRHRAEFDAYVLAARITATGLDNGLKLKDAYAWLQRASSCADGKASRQEVNGTLSQAVGPLLAMAGTVEQVATDASHEWDRTRRRGDPKKDNSSPRVRQRGARTILPILLQSNTFCRQWLREFRKRIAVHGRGGPFPGGI